MRMCESWCEAYDEGLRAGIRLFAEYIKQYAILCEQHGYDGIAAKDIEEKMEEFLEEE